MCIDISDRSLLVNAQHILQKANINYNIFSKIKSIAWTLTIVGPILERLRKKPSETQELYGKVINELRERLGDRVRGSDLTHLTSSLATKNEESYTQGEDAVRTALELVSYANQQFHLNIPLEMTTLTLEESIVLLNRTLGEITLRETSSLEAVAQNEALNSRSAPDLVRDRNLQKIRDYANENAQEAYLGVKGDLEEKHQILKSYLNLFVDKYPTPEELNTVFEVLRELDENYGYEFTNDKTELVADQALILMASAIKQLEFRFSATQDAVNTLQSDIEKREVSLRMISDARNKLKESVRLAKDKARCEKMKVFAQEKAQYSYGGIKGDMEKNKAALIDLRDRMTSIIAELSDIKELNAKIENYQTLKALEDIVKLSKKALNKADTQRQVKVALERMKNVWRNYFEEPLEARTLREASVVLDQKIAEKQNEADEIWDILQTSLNRLVRLDRRVAQFEIDRDHPVETVRRMKKLLQNFDRSQREVLDLEAALLSTQTYFKNLDSLFKVHKSLKRVNVKPLNLEKEYLETKEQFYQVYEKVLLDQARELSPAPYILRRYDVSVIDRREVQEARVPPAPLVREAELSPPPVPEREAELSPPPVPAREEEVEVIVEIRDEVQEEPRLPPPPPPFVRRANEASAAIAPPPPPPLAQNVQAAAASPLVSNDSKNSLLESIRKGTTLKAPKPKEVKVEETKPQEGTLASTLSAAMEARRAVIKVDEENDGDNDEWTD